MAGALRSWQGAGRGHRAKTRGAYYQSGDWVSIERDAPKKMLNMDTRVAENDIDDDA